MKTDKQSITDWIDLLSGIIAFLFFYHQYHTLNITLIHSIRNKGETWNVMKIGYQMKQVRERIAKGLVDKGVLRTEKKNFLLFDMATHPLADSVLKQSVTKKVIDALLGRGVQPDIRLICLICAAYASNVLENVLGNVTFSQRETAFQKAEEICNEFCAITDKTKASGTTDIVAAVCIIYSKVFFNRS